MTIRKIADDVLNIILRKDFMISVYKISTKVTNDGAERLEVLEDILSSAKGEHDFLNNMIIGDDSRIQLNTKV